MAGFLKWLLKQKPAGADEPPAAEAAAPAELPAPQPVEFANVTAPTAEEICRQIELNEQVKALSSGELTPGEFLQLLEEEKQYELAVDYVAHALPPRESVWWAAQSGRTVEGELTDPDTAALEAAESWVRNPGPETAAAATEAAAATDYQGPGAWAAQAAGWAEESSAATGQAIPPESVEIAKGAAEAAGLSEPAKEAIASGSVPADINVEEATKAADELVTKGSQTSEAAAAPTSTAGADVAGLLGVAAMFTSAASGSLAPVAVAGAVKISAAIAADAMPAVQAAGSAAASDEAAVQAPVSDISAAADAPPDVPAPDPDEVAKILRPFIDLGKEVAGGQNSWM